LELRAVPGYYAGRAIRRAWDPLLTGLSMHELHWHARVGGDGNSCDPWNRLAQLAATEVVSDAPGAVPCTYPALLLRIPHGNGGVLIDQTLWDAAPESVGAQARRIASTLLVNLGARFAPVAAAREVRGPLAYVPIDLSAFANRPLADDVAEDKQGGWSDQGPKVDGREFPTGRVLANGVPFYVGGPLPKDPREKCVLVFNGSHPAARFKPPFEKVVGIPVNRKVETLNFLHTGAWMYASKQALLYVVNYADGTKEQILVRSGVNIADWGYPAGWDGEFLNEEPGIKTRVGLIAGTPVFDAIAAYVMEWVNPWPEKEVATLEIVAPEGWALGNMTPIVMGITAGVKADEKSLVDEKIPGDRTKADGLTKDGEAAFAAGQYDKAEAALKQATTADPGYGRAFLALGRVYKDTRRLEDAAVALRRASVLIPDSTELLNDLAGVLEARGKKAQALAVYYQSLKVNWNQPPVLEALRRLK
jgi:beta-galactosidase